MNPTAWDNIEKKPPTLFIPPRLSLARTREDAKKLFGQARSKVQAQLTYVSSF